MEARHAEDDLAYIVTLRWSATPSHEVSFDLGWQAAGRAVESMQLGQDHDTALQPMVAQLEAKVLGLPESPFSYRARRES